MPAKAKTDQGYGSTIASGALLPNRRLAQALSSLSDSVIAVFLGCLLLAGVVRYYGFFPSVIDWDVSLYAVMAQDWLGGGIPYKTVWDQHSVGLPALFAVILYLFPDSMLAIRASGCVAVAVAATTIYFIAKSIERHPIAPIVAVLLYLAWTARLWGLDSNTELYINALMVAAMSLALREGLDSTETTPRLAPLCLAALFLGVALQIKHVAVLETLLFFALILLASLRRSWGYAARLLVLTGLSFLLPSIIVVLYFHSHGMAADYFWAVVLANLAYATERPDLAELFADLPKSVSLSFFAIAAAGVSLFAVFHRRVLLVVLWGIAASVDVALPGQFWPHYFLLIMPPAAILAGYLAAALYRQLRRRGGVAWLAVPLLVIAFSYPVGIYSDAMKTRKFAAHDAPSIIAEVIRNDLPPNASVFVFNYQPVVYFLTGARLPTRHVLPADWSSKFSKTTGVNARQELDRVFLAQPEYVVFLDKDWAYMGDDVLDALHRHLAVNYEKHFETLDEQILPDPVTVEVYRRKTPRSAL